MEQNLNIALLHYFLPMIDGQCHQVKRRFVFDNWMPNSRYPELSLLRLITGNYTS
jgi:hypothetical protein